MSEDHNSEVESTGDVKGHSFEYRSSAFDTRTAADRVRDLARRSPYFMIAVAMNLSLVAFATVWKLNEESNAGASMAPIVSSVKIMDDPDAKKIDEPEIRNIFSEEDVSTESSDIEPIDNAPDVDFPMDDYKFGDHVETANGEDYGAAKGNGLDSKLAGIDGMNLFNSIGTGGGSGRGDRSGYGGPFGGREQMKTKYWNQHKQIPRTETAADAGLRWLARHQSSDGSWAPETFTTQCQGGVVCQHSRDFGFAEHTAGNTGLALLAFLGAGYDHRSVKVWIDPFTHKTIRAGEVVRAGLLYLRDRQQEDGSFCEPTQRKWGYNHSIATLAMCEAYGLSRAQQFRQSAQRGIDALIAGQNPAPGGTGLWAWRYMPQCGDNDISVTGWAVMALKSAELAGLRISQDSLQGAFNFCEEVTDRTTGHVGYLARADAGTQVKAPGRNETFLNHPSFAAVGMCIRTFVKHNIDDPVLETSAKLIARDLPIWDKAKKSIDYYYWYYAALALNQYDGPDSPRPNRGQYWKEFESALKRALLDNQVQNAKLCSDGSWDGDDRWGVDGGGRVYATALNTLTFEVYYRYGNAFGTAKKGAAPKK